MAIEMLGARILAPYFGGSLSVWGSVITIFMLSLALGYLFGGQLSTRNPSLSTFAFFFMTAAISTLPIILFADSIMEPIFLSIEDPRYGSLLASVMLFFIPTTILGMISPYSVRLMVVNQQDSGHMAGFMDWPFDYSADRRGALWSLSVCGGGGSFAHGKRCFFHRSF